MNKTNNKKYKYDFPAQRELSKNLAKGDKAFLARKFGYSLTYISLMCKGERKMSDAIKQVVEKLIDMRKEIEEYEPATVE